MNINFAETVFISQKYMNINDLSYYTGYATIIIINMPWVETFYKNSVLIKS